MCSGHRGIYNKYVVVRKHTGETLDDCFVLRPTTDTAARIALATYAEATHNPELARDVRRWLSKIRMDDATTEFNESEADLIEEGNQEKSKEFEFNWKIEKDYHGDDVSVWASCFVDKEAKLCTEKLHAPREKEADVFRAILSGIKRAERERPDKQIKEKKK